MMMINVKQLLYCDCYGIVPSSVSSASSSAFASASSCHNVT